MPKSLFSKRNETLIDIDDVEEANLSEYEVGETTPKNNDCDRYSDLRASKSGSNTQGRERKRSNSDILATTPIKMRGSNNSEKGQEGAGQGSSFSDRVRNKDKSSLRKNAGGDLEDKVSIRVDEPSNKSPDCEAGVTAHKPLQEMPFALTEEILQERKIGSLVVDKEEGNVSDFDGDGDVKIDIFRKKLGDDQ